MALSFRSKILIVNLSLLLLFLTDRLTKWLALQKLPTEGVFVFDRLLGLRLLQNQNLALGLPLDRSLILVLTILIILILISLLVKSYQKREVFEITYLSLILTGAASNLIDRLLFGFVIDFIRLFFISVFNLADLLIIGGIGLWLIKISKK